MLRPNALTAQEDGSIAYTDADDITVVEPITKPVQTAGGYTRHEPDHELAALMAAAPDLLAALEAVWQRWDKYDTEDAPELAKQIEEAIARATNPDYVQNSIGQTRDRIFDPLLELIEEAEAAAKREENKHRDPWPIVRQARAEEHRVLEAAAAEAEAELCP